MNNIYSVTKGIQDILRSDDWTNSPRRQEMAEELSELSQKVSDLLDECRSLLEQGLGQEAASLAESQEPSLFRQFELLNFDGLSDWRELCQIYEWPVPPKLDGEVLEKQTAMSADAKNLQPLLNAYRMVARSEDVRAKVLLLRRLVRADAKSQEWRDMLLQQEEIWQKQLINEAKHAIIDKQYDPLQALLQKINDPEWSVKRPEQVTRKIEQVLEQHRLEELKKQAEKCLNSINEAYGNFEFDSLGAALGEWRDLTSLAGYQPDETELRQVKEAEEYYLQQNKERNEEARFQMLSERLRQGLENAAPQENLDMIYNQISLTGRQLPEHVERQYLTVKENYDLILRRKRILKVTTIAVSAAAVIGLAGLLSHMVIQNISERNWSSAIRKAMKEPTVASALDLVAKLQKNSPKLCERPGLTALIREVETMKINEENKRKDFTRRADVFRKELSNFAINREKLTEGLEELSRLVVDGREKEVLDKLTQDYTAQLELFQMQQLAVFDRIIAQINKKRGTFYTALEKTDIGGAKKIIAEIGLLEKQAAKIYAVIGKAFPGRENDFRQSEALTQRLNETTGKIARAEDIMPSIKSPMGLAQLRQNISDYLKLLPASPDTEALTKLSESVKFAEGVVAVLKNGDTADNSFSKDLEWAKQLQKNSRAALEKISGKYEKLAKYYKNNPVHAFIAKTPEGLIIDLYYTLPRSKNAKGARAAYRYQGMNADFKYNPLKAMKDEEGTTLDVLLSGTRGKKDVTVEIEGKTWRGKSLYPESWNKDEVHRGEINGGNIAPYIRGVQAVNSILQRADKDNAEPALHEALKVLLDNELINPFLRKNYCSDIIGALLMLDPSDSSYQRIKESLAAASGPSEWLLAFRECPDVQQKVQDVLATARAGKLRQKQTFFLNLWKALTAAELTPAGYISNKGGKRVFHQIYDAPGAGDLYFMSDTVTTRIGSYENGEFKLGANAEKLKIDYMILFTPKNARALLSAREEAEKMSKEQGFSPVDYPASWPIF